MEQKKQVVKKPNHKIILTMLVELLSVKADGDCFVPYAQADIQAQIDALKQYIG